MNDIQIFQKCILQIAIVYAKYRHEKSEYERYTKDVLIVS